MGDEMQIMVVKIGDNDYGLDTDEIKWVVKSQALSHLSQKGVSYIAGMINMDGIHIPVIDIHQKFGILSNNSCIMDIIIVLKGRMLAIPVDNIECVVNVPPECRYTVPEMIRNDGRQCICMIAEFDGRLLPVISAERLLAEID